jgi:hypothetical protein
MRALGLDPPLPPRAAVSRLDALRALWAGAGLEAIEARAITVERSYPGFDAFWDTISQAASMKASIASMTPADAARLKDRVRARLPVDAAGGITLGARANAVRGSVPA